MILVSKVDFTSKTWECVFCKAVKAFPPAYSNINEGNVPLELHPTSTTIDYTINKPTIMPAFLFVLDTCLEEEELNHLKKSILNTLELIPSTSYVGLVTFGSNVQVYSMVKSPCPKIITFDGDKETPISQLHSLMGIGKLIGNGRIQADINNDYIVSLRGNKKYIKSMISSILPDPFPVDKYNRPMRAVGAAVAISIGVIENTFAGLGGRVMVFTGGPATKGPGAVVSQQLKEVIRTHNELRKAMAKHVHTATKFYNRLAERVSGNGHTVDLFSCSMNQTGLLEMKSLCKLTGGIMVLSDGFGEPIFQKSLAKIFDKDENGNLSIGFNGSLDVITSNPLVLAGCIGHVASNKKDNPDISDNHIGVGGTYSWKLCSFDHNSNYAIYFDAKSKLSHTPPYAYIQFQTTYQHGSGITIRRITTVSRAVAKNTDPSDSYLPGFDQEASAALFARRIIYSCEHEDIEPMRTIDQTLIKLFKRFCRYNKNNSVSLLVPNEMSLYSNFMYYFRRSPLVQPFNNSPDETVYFRYCCLRENVSNILVMMHPSLESYTLDEDPQPVLLSSRSIAADNILLLDTFFHIIIHTGSTIAQWRNEGYHENPEYENIKELLTMPVEDAQELMKSRLPLPIYVECDQDTSQARFLLASVDPSFTHLDSAPSSNKNEGQMIFTEDVSLQMFFDKLAQYVVQDN